MQNLLCKLFGHKYDPWGYEADSSCTQIRKCVRSDDLQTRLHHHYSPWTYIADNTCVQTRICIRCQQQEKQTAEHDLILTRFDNVGYKMEVCRRCGDVFETFAPPGAYLIAGDDTIVNDRDWKK